MARWPVFLEQTWEKLLLATPAFVAIEKPDLILITTTTKRDENGQTANVREPSSVLLGLRLGQQPWG